MPLDQTLKIDVNAIRADAAAMFARPNARREHSRVLRDILDVLPTDVDFRELADIDANQPVPLKARIVVTVQEVLYAARELNCSLCRNGDFVYAFNGEFWKTLDRSALEGFLGEAAERLGVNFTDARFFETRTKLYKQFMAAAFLPKPERSGNAVLINLRNGTLEINTDGTEQRLVMREFRASDFLTYQLPFDYDPAATFSTWQGHLDKVLPDVSSQNVLAEFFGYVFAKNRKYEKCLILLGNGANGKSVIFEVLEALFGRDNISNVSLESLCSDRGYQRIQLANALLNYSSEISNRLQAATFKQLVSGEPIEARRPYGQPMTMTDYGRLAFNCNELPRDVEHTHAYFRRFLIVPFDVRIEEHERIANFSQGIIDTELPGVLNWVLQGLTRLLTQDGFSDCDAADRVLAKYKLESDSAAMFFHDERYRASDTAKVSGKDLYVEYRTYSLDNGYRTLGRNKFYTRIQNLGIARIDSYQTFFEIERGDEEKGFAKL